MRRGWTYICFKVGMGESLFGSIPLFGVKCLSPPNISISTRCFRPVQPHTHKRFRQKIYRRRRSRREKRCKTLLLSERQRPNVIPTSSRPNGVKLIQRRCARHVQYERQLMVIISPGKKWFSREHLGEDAAHGPNVNGFGILPECEHDFRGAGGESKG